MEGRIAAGSSSQMAGLMVSGVVAYLSVQGGSDVYVAFKVQDVSYKPINSSPACLATFSTSAGTYNADDFKSALPSTLAPGETVYGLAIFNTTQTTGTFTLHSNDGYNILLASSMLHKVGLSSTLGLVMPSARLDRPDLQIRRSRQAVRERPSWYVCWADLPGTSTSGRDRPPSWQQYWQQSHGGLVTVLLGLGLHHRRPCAWCRALTREYRTASLRAVDLPRQLSSHDGTSLMHPVVDPGQPRVLIGLDYLAAALADLAASVRFVISPGGVQLLLSLLDALRVEDVAE